MGAAAGRELPVGGPILCDALFMAAGKEGAGAVAAGFEAGAQGCPWVLELRPPFTAGDVCVRLAMLLSHPMQRGPVVNADYGLAQATRMDEL